MTGYVNLGDHVVNCLVCYGFEEVFWIIRLLGSASTFPKSTSIKWRLSLDPPLASHLFCQRSPKSPIKLLLVEEFRI